MPKKIFIDESEEGRFEIYIDPPHQALSRMQHFGSFEEAATMAFRLADQTGYAISDGTGRADAHLWAKLVAEAGAQHIVIGKLLNLR